MVVTVLLGGLALNEPQIAGALAVVVTIILASRTKVHDWINNVLTDEEIRDGLMLLAAALVILPLLPERPVDPWGVVDLRKLWTLAVLVMAINGLVTSAARGKEMTMQTWDWEKIARAAKSVNSSQMSDDFDRGYSQTLDDYAKLMSSKS